MDIEELKIVCNQLEDVTEDIKWERDLCFCIGKKMFCITSLSETMQVSLKVKAEEFDELCNTNNILPAPYVARYKWILITDVDRFNKKEWKHYLHQSYQLVKEKLSKKILKELSI